MPAQKKSARPNFFLLLGLDPDAPWDQALYEQALLRKRGEWSRQGAGVAKKALAAKQHLALLPQIIATMSDPQQREQEAEAARKALNAEKATRLTQFEKQLALINAKDTIEQDEIDHFIEAFKDLLSPQEIRARISAPLHSPAPEPATEPEDPPPLEESLLTSIDDRLHIVHMQTLYELLQLPRTTATSELQRAAEALYAQAVRLSPTAETTAHTELAGLARQIFSSDKTRATYDERLHQASLLRLFNELDESMKHSKVKELNHKQVLVLLSQARKDGWPEQETLERLKEHARQKKWIITLPALTPATEDVLCPNCQTLNPRDQRFCSSCEQALSIDCPRCEQPIPCEQRACGNCGFPVGNRYLVERLIEKLRQSLSTGGLARAQQFAEQATAIWQLGPDQQDHLSQQLAACRAQIRHSLAAQQQAQEDARDLLSHLTISEVTDAGRRQVHIAWPTPHQGTVQVFRSSQPLPQQGQTLPADNLDTLAGQRLPQVPLHNAAVDEWQPGQKVYYTPALLFQQQAHLACSQLYVGVEGISQLRYQNFGSALRLCWTWPPHSRQVRISYRTTHWPHHDSPDSTTFLLNRTEYDRLGYYEIRAPAHRDYYIAISTVLHMDDEQFFSQDAYLHVQTSSKTVMTYQIKPPTRFRKQRQLCLALDTARTLPALLVIAKQGQLPFRKTDGDLFYRIEATTAPKDLVVFELPASPLPPKTFGKLFLEDDNRYQDFTVHHPAMDQMRLS